MSLPQGDCPPDRCGYPAEYFPGQRHFNKNSRPVSHLNHNMAFLYHNHLTLFLIKHPWDGAYLPGLFVDFVLEAQLIRWNKGVAIYVILVE